MTDVIKILTQLEAGNVQSADELLKIVYDELRSLAARKLSREKPGQTLGATALVHEAYLRLVAGSSQGNWQNRRHFFSAAAEAMRRILIEAARRKKRLKRGGENQRLDLDEALLSAPSAPDELLAIDEALERLAEQDAVAAEIVKLRYFGGLSIEEAGEVLSMSRAQAYRHWSFARAWLRCEIRPDSPSGEPPPT